MRTFISASWARTRVYCFSSCFMGFRFPRDAWAAQEVLLEEGHLGQDLKEEMKLASWTKGGGSSR